MKKKLLLYLSRWSHPGSVPIAATLAWLAGSRSCVFDSYFDSYHLGGHFPGGDARNLEPGQLSGGAVAADRHFEELYFALLAFDVSVVSFSRSMLLSSVQNLGIPIVALSDRIGDLYRKVFGHFDVQLPTSIVMIGSGSSTALKGLEAYLYPEIYYRQAIGVPDSISDQELSDLSGHKGKILCVHVDHKAVAGLRERGYDVEIIDQIEDHDDYSSITGRLARRWKEKAKGWILGDPTLVGHWLPKACEEDLIALYGVPTQKVTSQLGDIISSKGRVVYGRQFSDRDFFELSKLNQCFQVIDPCRPPFQSVRHVEYDWLTQQDPEGFFELEYSDEELKRFAQEGRVLISLMFWSGMIREVACFYSLMDVIALTGLRCGLVVTAQSYEYSMHSPFELLTIPLGQGGVYPLVEPVLGSCGIGVGIESHMTRQRLQENLEQALSEISAKVKKQEYVPRGWWTTMDADLQKLPWWRRPKPIGFLTYSPYFEVRFGAQEERPQQDARSGTGARSVSTKQRYLSRLKEMMQTAGLAKYFSAYRPFEFYGPGPIKERILEVAKAVGFEYMFTKAGFGSRPAAQYLDGDFVALNYTAGQWDGWTPFETTNDVADLRRSEKGLLRSGRPGWIVSTIDSCLWTFGGELWKRGTRLYEIAQFCAKGGNSGRLINVKPFTVSRYARIIAEGGS